MILKLALIELICILVLTNLLIKDNSQIIIISMYTEVINQKPQRNIFFFLQNKSSGYSIKAFLNYSER